jgi:hypothetical protein
VVLAEAVEDRELSRHGIAATKMNWPRKFAKIAKKKQHKLLSLWSLRSFAAKSLLEMHNFSGWHCNVWKRNWLLDRRSLSGIPDSHGPNFLCVVAPWRLCVEIRLPY